MSDTDEHHFESKADAGASKTYPQQAGTVRKNGYIVIKGRPCKVIYRLVGIFIFRQQRFGNCGLIVRLDVTAVQIQYIHPSSLRFFFADVDRCVVLI
jgi:hypothetical protein